MARALRIPFHLALVAVSSAMVLLGCLPNTFDLGRQTAKGSVQGYYEGMSSTDREERHKTYQNLLNAPEVQQAARELAKSAVSGAEDAFGHADWDALTRGLSDAVADAMKRNGPSVASGVVHEVIPPIREAIRLAVYDSVVGAADAMRETATRDFAPVVKTLVEAATQATIEQFTEAAKNFPAEFAKGQPQQQNYVRAIMREAGAGVAEGFGIGLKEERPMQNLFFWVIASLAALLLCGLLVIVILWRRYKLTTDSLLLIAQKLNQDRLQEEKEEGAPHKGRSAAESWLESMLRQRGA